MRREKYNRQINITGENLSEHYTVQKSYRYQYIGLRDNHGNDVFFTQGEHAGELLNAADNYSAPNNYILFYLQSAGVI